MDALSEDTRVFLMKTFGCRRKVYNLYVGYYYEALEKAGYTGGDDIPDVRLPEVSGFKKAYPYLKEADSLALANAKISFQNAVKRFHKQYDHKSYTKRAVRRDKSGTEELSFRGLKGMPHFHSKAKGDFSYTTNCQYPSKGNGHPTIRLVGDILYLPKLKEGVKLVVHRVLPCDALIGNVTISMDTDGMFYAAIEYSYTVMMDMTFRDAVLSDDKDVIDRLSFLGLDYDQQDFYVDSEGRKANYPKYYRESERRLAKLQRELSRMEKDSAHYKKKQQQIAKLHKKVRNQRKDFVNKEACHLSRTYDVIVVEDINLNHMGRALSLGKNLHDNGFGMFRERLGRKLEEKGSVLVYVDRFFASTKTCSSCGEKNPHIRIGVDRWICPVCGAEHDRDQNAAINIREEGKRIFAKYFREWLSEEEKAQKRAEALKAGRKKKNKKASAT